MVRPAILCAALLLGAAGAWAQEPAPDASEPAPAQAVPRFEDTECWVEQTPALDLPGIRCGYLVVPERREAPDERLLRLAVAILPSRSAEPLPDPVLYLHGGPGGFAIGSPVSWIASPLRDDRELILLDQRGVGFSEPKLCPDLSVQDFRVMAGDHAPGDEIPERIAVAEACRDELLADGFDLSAWNSTTSGLDVEDLRQVLGIEEWNLLGVSYGTRLALGIMRATNGEGLRSVILDSAYPPWAPAWDSKTPDFARALNEFFKACEADQACDKAYPDLRGRFREALARLVDEPATSRIPPNAALPDGVLVNNAQDLAITLHQLLYDSRTYGALPLLIDEFVARNESVASHVAEVMSLRGTALSRGVNLIVECYERAPFQRRVRQARYDETDPLIAEVHTYFDADYDVCAAWSDKRARDREARPVRVDVPTLVMGGRFDPITPPEWGERVSRTLPDARFLEFPVGHGAYRSHACARQVAGDFVDDPAAILDARCIDRMPPPDYWTRVRHSPDTWTLLRGLALVPDLKIQAALGGGLLLLLVGVAGFGIRRVSHRVSGKAVPLPQLSAHRLVLGTVWTAVAFWVAFLALVFWVGARHSLLAVVGLPVGSHVLLWVPILGLALAAAAALRLWNDWDDAPLGRWCADAGLWLAAVLMLGLRFAFDL